MMQAVENAAPGAERLEGGTESAGGPTEGPSPEAALVMEPLQRVPFLLPRALVYALSLLVVAAVLFSFRAGVDVTARGRGVVRALEHPVVVLSPGDGILKRIQVSEGASVKKGAPLFLVGSSSAGGGPQWIVTAPFSGMVSRLNVEVAGKRVWKDDPLCTILPLGGPLFMDLAVPERDGALLREDMEIAYRFDAFARLGYGMVRGKVSAVSPVVLEDADGRTFYRVRGSLETIRFEKEGEVIDIRPGMKATAVMVMGRMSVFSLLTGNR